MFYVSHFHSIASRQEQLSEPEDALEKYEQADASILCDVTRTWLAGITAASLIKLGEDKMGQVKQSASVWHEAHLHAKYNFVLLTFNFAYLWV